MTTTPSRRDTIAADIAYVRSVLDEMADTADAERSDTDQADFDARWDEGFAFVQAQRAELDRIDRIASQRAEVAAAANIPGAAIPGTDGEDQGRTFHAPNLNLRTVDEAYDVSTVDRSRGFDAQIVGRAKAVIEKGDGWLEDSHREAATRTIERLGNSNRAAEQILLGASPSYRSAFFKHARNAEAPGSADLTAEERYRMQEVDALLKSTGFWNPVDANEARALALTNVTGKLVPSQLDTSVIIVNDGAANPFRMISRVIPVSTNVWTGVSTAGITAGWTGTEGTEVDDDAPSFSNPAVTCYMADAFVPISFQGYEDWTGAANELDVLFQDARDRLEEAAFATGSGSNEPTGIVTALNGTASVVEMATAGAYGLTDLYSLKQALPDRYKARARFVSAEEYLDRTRQFGTSENYHGFTVDLSAGDVTQVFGKPWHQSTTMTGTLSASTTNSAIVYGDWQHYVIADRIGMVVEFVPNLFHTGNNRPSGQRGWLAHWRTGADSIADGAFRLLQNQT